MSLSASAPPRPQLASALRWPSTPRLIEIPSQQAQASTSSAQTREIPSGSNTQVVRIGAAPVQDVAPNGPQRTAPPEAGQCTTEQKWSSWKSDPEFHRFMRESFQAVADELIPQLTALVKKQAAHSAVVGQSERTKLTGIVTLAPTLNQRIATELLTEIIQIAGAKKGWVFRLNLQDEPASSTDKGKEKSLSQEPGNNNFLATCVANLAETLQLVVMTTKQHREEMQALVGDQRPEITFVDDIAKLRKILAASDALASTSPPARSGTKRCRCSVARSPLVRPVKRARATKLPISLPTPKKRANDKMVQLMAEYPKELLEGTVLSFETDKGMQTGVLQADGSVCDITDKDHTFYPRVTTWFRVCTIEQGKKVYRHLAYTNGNGSKWVRDLLRKK